MKYINEKDAETLKGMFTSLENDVNLTYFKRDEDCETCPIAEELLTEVSSLSDKLKLTVKDVDADSDSAQSYGIDKVPALVVEGSQDRGIRFYGVPSGYEFNSLLNAFMLVSRGEATLPVVIRVDLDNLDEDIHLQVFVTPNCPHCPSAVKTAHNFAMYSDKVRADMIEISEFPDMAKKYEVMSVPKIVINEEEDFVGALSDVQFLEKIMARSSKS